MRTTLNSIYSQINTNINNLTSDLEKINSQISSGSQMAKISDDPVNLVSALRFRTNISQIDQYSENISLGITTITASEDALREMKELTIRAKELAIQAINPVLSSSEHLAIAEEIKNLNEQAVMLANGQINGKYVFAGQRTTGYTDAEPSPFVMDQGSGQWLNGEVPPSTGPLVIPADTLKINGITIDATTAALDTDSTINNAASATSKAAVINKETLGAAGVPGTGVSAEIIPANIQGTGPVTAGGALGANEFLINNVDIGTGLTLVGNDQDNVLLDAINNATATTGVKAARDDTGTLILTAIDGRNIQVSDTTVGNLTGLASNVIYGAIKLSSDREFTLEDADPATELSFAALGIKGGASTTNESGDVADDGQINVVSIHKQSGNVRYNGDFENDLKIKIGKNESMVIGFNGKKAVADTSIFTALQDLEDSLRGSNYTSVSGIEQATPGHTDDLLNSGTTGLEGDGVAPFVSGSFSIIIADHDYEPPREKTMTVNIDPTTDTLKKVASRIDGVANISAAWNSDGELQISSDNPDRYTFSLTNDSSNFLKNTGVDSAALQYNGLNQSLDNLDFAMNAITENVSSFGAKANRIDVQLQIYSGLKLAAETNLSEVQDTDIVKAIMDLKAKETAYQATLAAAAKTMQLSLVDYL